MNWNFLNVRFFVPCLLGIFLTTPSCLSVTAKASIEEKTDVILEDGLLGNPCNHAKLITVNILKEGAPWGSGVLFQRQGTHYTVLTSAHLLKSNKYEIKTPDNKIHQSSVLKRFDSNLDDKSKNYDLALLEFDSTENYQLATLADSPILNKGEEVFAAGFPANPNLSSDGGFVCQKPGGKISFVLNRPMEEGYQIGYFIDIAKGMSGGALLNAEGKVIGINGKHSDPILFINRELYRYQDDGSLVNEDLGLLSKSSWAIPIETFISINKVVPSLTSPLPGSEDIYKSVALSNNRNFIIISKEHIIIDLLFLIIYLLALNYFCLVQQKFSEVFLHKILLKWDLVAELIVIPNSKKISLLKSKDISSYFDSRDLFHF